MRIGAWPKTIHSEGAPIDRCALAVFICVTERRNYKPSFLAMCAGMALLWMRMFIVL